jgi:hypothetical protein
MHMSYFLIKDLLLQLRPEPQFSSCILFYIAGELVCGRGNQTGYGSCQRRSLRNINWFARFAIQPLFIVVCAFTPPQFAGVTLLF